MAFVCTEVMLCSESAIRQVGQPAKAKEQLERVMSPITSRDIMRHILGDVRSRTV